MWPMIAAGAGLGLVQGHIKEQQEARDRAAAAETARWAPWTGMQPQQVQSSGGAFGGALQGAVAGAQMGQSMDQNEAYQNYLAGQQKPPQTVGYGQQNVGYGNLV